MQLIKDSNHCLEELNGKISRRITGFTYVSLVKFSHGYSLSMYVSVLIIKTKSPAVKCFLTLNKNYQNYNSTINYNKHLVPAFEEWEITSFTTEM